MPFHRNKLYLLLSAACLAGYIWLYVSLPAIASGNEVCLIKHVTNMPCPSCGSTRSVMALLQGHFMQSIYWNPFGLLLLAALVGTPIWIAYDLYTRKNSLQNFYLKTETALQKKAIAIPAILMVLCNWCWNIYKGL
jgi:Protein of unknown function (DUF2752)